MELETLETANEGREFKVEADEKREDGGDGVQMTSM